MTFKEGHAARIVAERLGAVNRRRVMPATPEYPRRRARGQLGALTSGAAPALRGLHPSHGTRVTASVARHPSRPKPHRSAPPPARGAWDARPTRRSRAGLPARGPGSGPLLSVATGVHGGARLPTLQARPCTTLHCPRCARNLGGPPDLPRASRQAARQALCSACLDHGSMQLRHLRTLQAQAPYSARRMEGTSDLPGR